ncbi:MAG: ribosome recycling factor, partial [Armatimonadetes bacterium]|nr:ribosome recycling factor [Armatimonadota bacterium]
MNEILQEAERKMKHAVEATSHDFQRIRTGRANPIMLEKVMVDYYGSETPVNQVANISVPEPRVLMLTPWEKNMIGPIEKAIQKSDLGVNPNNDGINIRLTFPQMTEERRKELIKQVHTRTEEGCVAIRNVRHHALDQGKAKLKTKELSEDDIKSLEKR